MRENIRLIIQLSLLIGGVTIVLSSLFELNDAEFYGLFTPFFYLLFSVVFRLLFSKTPISEYYISLVLMVICFLFLLSSLQSGIISSLLSYANPLVCELTCLYRAYNEKNGHSGGRI